MARLAHFQREWQVPGWRPTHTPPQALWANMVLNKVEARPRRRHDNPSPVCIQRADETPAVGFTAPGQHLWA